MLVKTITTDTGGRQVGSWQDIESAIRLLNGLSVTEVVALIDENHYLSVSGGNEGLVRVYASLGEASFFEMTTPTAAVGQFKSLNCGGQAARVPMNRVVSLEDALGAARLFGETGKLYPVERWIRS